MAHQVDTGQQWGQRVGVADVDLPASVREHRVGSVCGGQQDVDADDVVASRPECCAHPGTDETGRAGQQHPHGSSNGNMTPVCARQCVHVRSHAT